MVDSDISVTQVQKIYDKAYGNPGLMGTQLDSEYSQVTKTTLLEMCLKNTPRRLLDVGTGDGDLWQFTPINIECHGIDISQVGIKRTTERFSSVLGVAAIAENLPYAGGYFGAVVAADTIEHVFDVPASLREIRRVLTPGGLFALSVPTPNSLPKWAYNRLFRQRPSPVLLAKLIHTVARRTMLFGRPTFQPIDRDHSLEEWQSLLDDAGFVVDRTVSWPHPPQKPIVYLIGARSDS